MAKPRKRPPEPPQALTIELITTDELYLDDQNPRLAMGGEDQRSLITELWTKSSLDELALSIVNNGYFQEEPLLAVREQGRYVVVEGNRRLATVKLLRDENLREQLKATDLPRASAEVLAQLERLPVSIYPDRKSLWAYVGFRHVNGPMTWDSWSKARYIALVRNRFGVSLDKIAASIGDKHQTVRRLYRGLMVLEQATTQAGYELDDRSKNHLSFSHLYTGLDYAGFQKHLGLKKDGGFEPNPVPKEHRKNLKELMVWLYGSRAANKAPVVRSQNPDLTRLDDVLRNKRALSALRAGLGLEVSHQVSLGEEKRFRETITRIRYDLQQARGLLLEGYRGERDLLDAAHAVAELATDLLQAMQRRSSSATRAAAKAAAPR